ncbi:MAG: hypothetical protein V3T23_01780 [Nitrososphaerales archaeon]
MLAPCTVIVKYIYRCDVPGCESKEERGQRVKFGYKLPHVFLPSGWVVVRDITICPLHRVRIDKIEMGA